MNDCEEQKHLLICAIGPVQDFIATARTSHDLAFGSWLLSELSKAAAKVLFSAPHQLIFPAPEAFSDLDPGTELNVTNKVIALISGDPKTIAGDVRKAIALRLEDIRQAAYNDIQGRVDDDLARDQIGDLVEFYWASVPDQDYKIARSKAEALLAARKNTRNFEPCTGKQGRPKSSLDGIRESVLLDTARSLGGEYQFYACYHAEAGEALSGVDLLKRWGDTGSGAFLSTTDVAAIPFELSLGESANALRERIQGLLKTYTLQGETEGTYFYGERLAQLIPAEKREEFLSEFGEIMKPAGTPSPYYALLLADGDNMGRAIDGLEGISAHQAISGKLSLFAQEARALIKKHEGVPVYVGGDDVLAYLPLHTALSCVEALNRLFVQSMADVEGGSSLTLSGGLVLAHHLTPLRDVLALARKAERLAKGVDGKNGLAIALSKRGGEERMAVARMGDLSGRMETLVRYARLKQVSTGTAYELQRLYRDLSGARLDERVLQLEATRIIQRKRESGGDQKVDERVREQFLEWFAHADLSLDQLAQEMIIAGEFARAYDMAYGKLEKERQV